VSLRRNMATRPATISVDAVRDYWDRRPCNIRHSTKPIGTREYFDEVERRKYLVEPHIPDFAQFDRWSGKRVLEIGCGIGTDTINFARAGADVTAVELSSESLSIARQRARVYELDHRIHLFQGDAEALSAFLPPQAYDLIYSFGVIHHTPHPERVLHEVRSHFVNPNSEFRLMLYHRWSWKALWILITYGKFRVWRWDEDIARYSEAQTGCPVAYTFSRRQARRILERQGFTIQRLFVEHIFPYRIQDYIEHRHIREWYWRLLPRSVFRAFERRFGWHLCITAVPAEGVSGEARGAG
jgi:SAM-dependent methyltransferase